MKTIEQVIDHLQSILDGIEMRPGMYGSTQSEIFLDYINILMLLSFITEKPFDLYNYDVIIAKKMKHDILNTSLPGHHYDDDKFMQCLKMYRKIFNNEVPI